MHNESEGERFVGLVLCFVVKHKTHTNPKAQKSPEVGA
jgi:hypothetical protein